MRFYCYQLGVKHPLPYPVKELENGQYSTAPQYFHSVLRVGVAVVSADTNDARLYLQLLDTPDSFFYEMAFAQNPPKDRASFLRMLESIGQVSSLLCYRQESVDIFGDAEDFFEYQCDLTETAYQKISQALYVEI